MLPVNIPEVFLDTDVAFDIISKREPHFSDSVKLLELAALGKIQLLIAESSLANLFYLTFDIYKLNRGNARLIDFIEACSIIHGRKQIALEALQSSFKDKEDALQYFTAKHSGADHFISRNTKDYKKYQSSELKVLSPKEFMSAQ